MESRWMDLAVFLASLLALALRPALWGYLLALAISTLSFKRLIWIRANIVYISMALLIYAVAFAVDLLTGPKGLPADLLVADVLAPVVEEVVFRGLAFKVLPRWGAFFISTAVFAVLHPYPLLAFVYALALTFAYLGGGLAASIALHAANNIIWTAIYLGLL